MRGTRGRFRGTLATSDTSSDRTGCRDPPPPRRSPRVSPTPMHGAVPCSPRVTVDNEKPPDGPEYEDELAGHGTFRRHRKPFAAGGSGPEDERSRRTRAEK